MLDALTIGSSIIDIFITSEDFELQNTGDGVFLCQLYGAKLEIDSFELCTGGGGSDVAAGLARAGLATATIAELGRDVWSGVVLQDFARFHVDTEYVIRERREQTGGSVILIGHDGGRTVMVHRGASSQLDPLDINERAFQRTQLVHLSSIAGRKETLKRIFELAKKYHVKLSWNPGSAEIALLNSGEVKIDENLPVKMLLVNAQEWDGLKIIQQDLLNLIPEIVVTNGGSGLDIYYNQAIEHLPAAKIEKVVDETGAGDAFASGYLAARFNERSPIQAAQLGVKNAGSVVSKIGAKSGLLSYEELFGGNL